MNIVVFINYTIVSMFTMVHIINDSLTMAIRFEYTTETITIYHTTDARVCP